MARIDVGLVLPQRAILFGAADWTDLLDLARAADSDARFGSLWVGDSIMAKARPDAIAILGALAAITRRVRLGVGCMASFPLRDPVVFAAQWASLDSLSDGRMQLAVCTGIGLGGTSAREGAVWGVPDTERGARMAENIEICRRLWTEDDVGFAGCFRSFDHATIRPQPTQRPCPIWIAANPQPAMAEKPLRRVAKIADGFMLAQVWPGLFATLWPKLERYLRDEGRDPDGFPTVAYMNINITRDRQSALAETKRFLEEYYGPVFSPEMTAAWTAAGTPAQCAEHLHELIKARAKAIALRITGWDQKAQFERLAGEVVPLIEDW
jgi:alkanesulfonate monooxygenase SsuD/methylene tetrahydromethanopterin reductase-like flavin-dependent oxidoreductase (luciferase family)